MNKNTLETDRQTVELLERMNVENIKNRTILSTALWSITGVLVILKSLGLSQLSWFWSTFMMLLPLYMVGIFLGVCLLVFIGILCVFVIITGIESLKKKKKKK